jgi:hypothetical protein
MKKFKKSKKRLLESQSAAKEEKKSSKTLWMSIFISAIMILSVIGFMTNGNDSSNPDLDYNDFSFSMKDDNTWTLNLKSPEKQQIEFYNHPSQVDYINITPEALSSLASAKMVYATSDPEDLFKDAIGLAEFEMREILGNKGVFFVYSFTKKNQFNKTIITCRNSTFYAPVIYLKMGNETGISYDNSGIILESDSEAGILRLRDRLLYGFLGVIR